MYGSCCDMYICTLAYAARRAAGLVACWPASSSLSSAASRLVLLRVSSCRSKERRNVGVVRIDPPVHHRLVALLNEVLLDAGVPFHDVQLHLDPDSLEVRLHQFGDGDEVTLLPNVQHETEWLAVLPQDAILSRCPP